MKKLFVLAGFIMLALGCTPSRDSSIQIFWDQTPTQAAQSATLQATEIHGMVAYVEPTGSMEPYITGGDYAVVDTNVQYKDIKQGWMLTYQARWLVPTHPPVMHWAAEKLGNEWIMDGQHNAHYESSDAYRMGEGEFMSVNRYGQRIGGRVIAVYTTRHKV